MNKSESIKDLAAALAKFQGEVKNPANTANNPFFKSKYAPLNEVLNLVRPILSKNGLSVLQSPSGDGENIIVTTTLLHESGEWIELEPLVLKADKPTAQGAGSAITYARRYALSAVLGISSEDDDDGNHTEPSETGKDDSQLKKVNKANVKETNRKVDANMVTEQQLKYIHVLSNKKGIDDTSLKNYIKSMFNKESSKDLTKIEAGELINALNGLEDKESAGV